MIAKALKKYKAVEVEKALDLFPRGLDELYGHETVVRLLLENGANIEAKDENELTALRNASQRGYETVVRLLLENRANIEAKSIYGITALRRAALTGHEIVVRLLLEKGANVEAKDKDGWTALRLTIPKHKVIDS